MVDVATIIAVVVSVATSTASLAYWLGKKFTEIEIRFNAIENRLEKLEERVGRLENVFVQFSEVLITMLEMKNLLTQTEAMTLRSLVRTILPIPKTKYYTWEVYERLKQLLDKDPNDYTMADIEEMNQIADLIEKEGTETNRKDLIDYAWKLRFYAMIAKVVFIYPKLIKQQQQQQK
ncbi:hypothetical protein [Vulcanisaeta sp. JCM 14467]|uniref:hypothetical protein n=1 Tax=Vulcanisaeta sp. JCM 14467 TaxID=1295370 RepID=UPI0006D06095|nr:hypothetical protein [Vulcanisaeta sp. JCM 14467]